MRIPALHLGLQACVQTTLVGFVVAQSYVVPMALDGVEGDSSSLIPFGFSGQARVQSIYDGSQLPFGPGTVLSRIRMRPDAQPGGMSGKPFLTVQVLLSTTTTEPDSASVMFDDNHGVDEALVVANGIFSLPTVPPPSGNGPQGFLVDFPFEVPWTYATTPIFGEQAPDNLCVELRVLQQPNGMFRLDTPLSCTSTIGGFGSHDPSTCLLSTGLELGITSTNSVLAGGNVNYTLAGMQPMAPAVVGVSVLPREIPIDLGDPVLPRPAPGCFLNLDFLLTDLTQANAGGVATAGFAIPSDLRLVGLPIFAQAICADPSANPLGFVTSPGITTTVCGPLPVTRIFSVGPVSNPSGQQNFGTCLVLEFQ